MIFVVDEIMQNIPFSKTLPAKLVNFSTEPHLDFQTIQFKISRSSLFSLAAVYLKSNQIIMDLFFETVCF